MITYALLNNEQLMATNRPELLPNGPPASFLAQRCAEAENLSIALGVDCTAAVRTGLIASLHWGQLLQCRQGFGLAGKQAGVLGDPHHCEDLVEVW
jgi:hypothetical protein